MTKLYDKFDKKIFQEIEFNYKIPHSTISKKIKRSKSFVTYRIKKMEEKGLINYIPLIDYSKLGLIYFRIIIESPLDLLEVRNKLQKLQIPTAWIVEKYDKENLVLVFLAKSNAHLHQIWDDVHEELGRGVVSKNISSAFKVYHLSNNYFSNGEKLCFETGGSESIILSEAERKVLDEISNHPQASNKELSKKTDFSETTVKKAIKELENKKVILGYQTHLNKEILNIKAYKVFMAFEFSKKNKLKLIELLKTFKNVVYITESSYEYDLECEIYLFEQEDISKIIQSIKEKFEFDRIVLALTKIEKKLA